METLHPSKADPNDSAAAFQEYAASTTWTIVHIGQFFAALLVALALVALARSLSRQGGVTGALAVIGGATAILVAAIFAVQMAVDGVVLKATIDTWSNATQAADKSSAYQVAEATRWLEKALSGFFHLANGTTLLILGLAIAFGRGYPRWLGWVGAASGLGFLTGGVVTAYTGFSQLAGTVLLGPVVLVTVFLLGAAVCMWRREQHRPITRRPLMICQLLHTQRSLSKAPSRGQAHQHMKSAGSTATSSHAPSAPSEES